MSQLSLKKIKLGDNADLSKNFVISVPAVADGTLTIERENGTDVLSIDADGDVTVGGKLKQAIQSMVRLNTANGYGSTNTKIRRFTNVVTNQGTDITYADSVTLGASFTINTAGVYAISHAESCSANGSIGISVNTTAPTTTIHSIPLAEIVDWTTQSGVGGNGISCAATLYLQAGAVVRAHNDGTTSGALPTLFTITRIA